MATPTQTWLNFALQQMAAESYLDQVLTGRSLIEVLTNGNNNENIVPGDQFTGKTRFVDLSGVPNANQVTGSAQAFDARYDVIDHHANDATGFSATLLFDTQTQTHTLSFRSTEFLQQVDGGDRERDGFGADFEISSDGFAFGQLAAMEEYFARLKQGIKSDGTVDASLQAFFSNPSHQLNVTGYSLGSHLATMSDSETEDVQEAA